MTGTLRRLSLQAAALALAAAPLAPAPRAQTRDASRQKEATKTARARRGAAESRAARERREAAAVILEVAASAREIEEPAERADLLSECADALWPADQAAARALFRRAWEAASEADEAARQAEQRPGFLRFDTLSRRGVAAAAAKRDARLAEEFLAELRASAEEQAPPDEAGREGGTAPRRTKRCAASAAAGQRLELANSLLHDGAHQAAAEVAAPLAVCGADGNLVLFLFRLRAHAPDRAHALFLRVLEATRSDPAADANSALAAAVYLAPPGLLTTVDEQGSVSLLDAASGGAQAPAEPVPRRVGEAFYDAAAGLLLRPPQAEAGGANSPAALYFAIGRLLPFFKREAPRHAPALHARRAALAAEIEPARRAMLEQRAGVRSLVSGNQTDPLRPYNDWIEQAQTPAARDGWRLSAARTAARRRIWDRARQFAREIEDNERRRFALLIIAAYQVATLHEAYDEASEENVERAVAFVREADVPPALRALGLTRAAALAEQRRDRARALELLEEAFSRAAEADKPFRVAAALLTAGQAARLDSPRVWEALAAAVRAHNTDGDEAGPEAFRGAGEWPGEVSETFQEVFGRQSLEEIFEALAPRDFARALAEARGLKDEVARSYSLVAAARAAIERKEGGPRGAR